MAAPNSGALRPLRTTKRCQCAVGARVGLMTVGSHQSSAEPGPVGRDTCTGRRPSTRKDRAQQTSAANCRKCSVHIGPPLLGKRPGKGITRRGPFGVRTGFAGRPSVDTALAQGYDSENSGRRSIGEFDPSIGNDLTMKWKTEDGGWSPYHLAGALVGVLAIVSAYATTKWMGKTNYLSCLEGLR